MRQFVVPQFLDVEDKIIGPISVRQFIILLTIGIIIFLNYEIIYKITLDFWFFAISSIIIFGFGGTMAFLRINGRPFHYFLLNIIYTLRDPRLRVWNKNFSAGELKRKSGVEELPAMIPQKEPLSGSKLARLSLIVDTGGAYQESEEQILTEKK